MNHVVEELGTVLSYRAEQLQLQAQQGSIDMEDMVANSSQQSNAGGDDAGGDDASQQSRRKRPRKISGKQKGGRANMGPITTTKGAGGSGELALCLSSRRNMCIHERVMGESDREAVDAACRSMTASWVVEHARQNPTANIETCSYFDDFSDAGEATSRLLRAWHRSLP